MMKTFFLTLILCNFIYLVCSTETSVSLESTTTEGSVHYPEIEHLGLIIKTKTVKLPTLTKIQKVRLFAKIGFTKEEVTNEFQKISTELNKLNSSEALKETGDVPNYISRNIKGIFREYDNVVTETAMILSYQNEENAGDKFSCEQTLPGLPVDYFRAFLAEIKTNVAFFKTSLRTADLTRADTDITHYELMVTGLFKIKETIADVRKTTRNYAILLDGLTSYKLSDINQWNLQATSCVEDFNIEKYTLESCTKIKNGIECFISLKVFKNTKKIELFAPISYHNYQLAIPENEIIGKDDTNNWGKLKCIGDPRNIIRDDLIDSDLCNFTPDVSPCLQNIQTHDFNIIKKYCHFENTYSEPVIQTVYGLLVQSNKVAVREIGKNNKAHPVSSRIFPYLLQTNRTVSVIKQDTEELFEPIFKGIRRKIILSFLTEIQSKGLTALQTLQTIDWNFHPEDYLLILGLSIIILFLLTIMMLCFRNHQKIRNFLTRTSSNQDERERRRSNYRMNRLLLRSQN